MELQGATILVTGGNRGIGRAIVDELSDRGADVLAGVRELDASHELKGASCRRVRIDLSTPESIESSVTELGTQRIDVLVNNAGVFTGGLLETQDVPSILELLQVNLAGAIHLTRMILPQMLERGTGKLVVNTSIIGHAPFPGASTYAASKSGLVGFTQSLRRELEDTGVSVLELVTPGVDTDMMDEVQRVYEGHSDASSWDHVDPEDWAKKVADAIESDDEQLNPGGGEWLAKLAPKRLLDAAAKRGFDR
jgi:short-subunit dehydrogenase